MNDDRNTTGNSTQWIVPALIVGLILWGAFVAVGAYLGGERFGYDPKRGLVVAVAVLAFLAFWGVLLYSRRRRGK
jgi:membrane protein DedA with SNARE-associated domain